MEGTVIPEIGSRVVHRGTSKTGSVINSESNHGLISMEIKWMDGQSSWHEIRELSCGFKEGDVVQDKPKSNTRKSLGSGTVKEKRVMAAREQVLVQLHETGESRWLPYENLLFISPASGRFRDTEADSAERFRLKVLAYALDSWNQVTGSLDRFDVDPLPHQIDLVHKILTSDQVNWLIADDVGLGKTIEVGLLLAALKRRHQARRVLIVCPAGIVRQWQDEMQYKFNEDFRIYGLDFNINNTAHWGMYDKVIVSIDRAKGVIHNPLFRDSGEWDIIVFDEAHHLSKIPNQSTTQRYRLAATLRNLTDAFIFLTGTPHQGNVTQFVNLLSLVRPDLRRQFINIFSDPSVVAEVVLRNKKSQVTDANGAFIFRGRDTRLIEVPSSKNAEDFDAQLQSYLRNGYAVSLSGESTARAIGFVMTTYRKLASSSIAAIERALQFRKARLENASMPQSNEVISPDEDAFEDGTDGRDDLADLADPFTAGAQPFFENELSQINALLSKAASVKQGDQKMNFFLSKVIDPLHAENERVVIFTEYRATQNYLSSTLEKRYAHAGVVQINGSMSLKEKRASIDQFNQSARFMISTEAGGEGINLHQNCHVLVNYDLPWNPSRLVQRVGRLYRYGQKERVVTFNLKSTEGFDNKTLGKMLDRVITIARDMASVNSEYPRELQEEIVGELLERVDVASILANNKTLDITHTDEEIETAIAKAKEAQSQQEKLFSQVGGYDPSTSMILSAIGPDQVLFFLEGILPYNNVHIRNRLYNGRMLELQLPDEMRGKYSEFGDRSIVRVTVNRGLVQASSQSIRPVAMDFASDFFSDLISFGQSPAFKGDFANITAPQSGCFAIYKIRWQNDQGVPREEELLPVFLPQGTEEAVPHSELLNHMLTNSVSSQTTHSFNQAEWQDSLKYMADCAELELSNRCTPLRHPNDIILLAKANLVALQ